MSTHAARAAGQSWRVAGRQAGMSRQAVGKVVKRFNVQGLAALEIAPERWRKVTNTRAQRARMLQKVRRVPDSKEDGTSTWSLKTLEQAPHKEALLQVVATTIPRVLHTASYAFGKTRSWCPTGTAFRKRKVGIVTVLDPAERAGLARWCQDEAGPYQAIPQPGEDWHPADKHWLCPMSTNARARPYY